MKNEPLVGAHVSVQGGTHTAFQRAQQVGCRTMQVFTRNQTQWASKPLSDDAVVAYRSAASASTVAPVVAHASYLINLCAVNADTLRKSRGALEDELTRADLLGLKGVIFHPGAHMGRGEPDGLALIAESLNVVHAATPSCTALTLIEATAGQGTALGYRFEHLRAIIDGVEAQTRVAVCLDTCHLFAAGYDVSTAGGWERTMKEFDEVVGLQRLMALHVNDSKKGLGSRVDRHEHIGKGAMGLEGFRAIMNDARLTSVPKILETEKSDDMHEDVENLQVLRSLVA